jgi:hypothetical protein
VTESETLSSSELLFLTRQSTAPFVASESFWVTNNRRTSVTLRHQDNFNTVFAEIIFPVGAILRSGGQDIGQSDSVQVAITPSTAGYSLVITPADMGFSTLPTIVFSASVYGDFTIAANSQRYANPDQYLRNLEVWE